jgi:hypothetical protein
MGIYLPERFRFLAKHTKQHIGECTLNVVAYKNRGSTHYEFSLVQTYFGEIEGLHISRKKMIIHLSL